MHGKRTFLALIPAVLMGTLAVAGPPTTEVPADTPEQFANRYEAVLDSHRDKALLKTTRELNKLAAKRDELTRKGKNGPEREKLDLRITELTEQAQPMIVKFWADHDTDPTTPENEFKQLIDERIGCIAAECLMANPDAVGLSFSLNGGFRSMMARIFLLYGPPDGLSVLEHQTRTVDLMLWLYADSDTGQVHYAFLFYRRGSIGPFDLFPQDIYQTDLCQAANQILQFPVPITQAQACPPEVLSALTQLANSTGSGGLSGRFFVWALTEFSMSDPTARQGQALAAPMTAADVAHRSSARIMGEAPTAPTTPIIASTCASCQSTIPAVMDWARYIITIPLPNVDWQEQNGILRAPLELEILFLDLAGNGPPVWRKVALPLSTSREHLTAPEGHQLVVDFAQVPEIKLLQKGSGIHVLLKSTLTNKYAAWQTVIH